MNKLDIEIGDIVKAYETWYMVQNINDSQLNVIDIYEDEYCCIDKENVTEIKIPCQYKTIYKREEPILDDKEKEYLSAVIRPFKEKVSYIVKHAEISDYGGEEIYIYYKCMSGEFNEIILPSFEAGTMYKGMELYKKYTLEELGL